MDYKDILKKYWFIGIVAVLMVVFLGIYSVDAYNNREIKVNSKKVGDSYAVLSVDGDYLMADELYDSLYDYNGVSAAFNSYSRAVIDAAIPTTEEISTYVANYAYYITQSNSKDSIDQALRNYGYDGFDALNDYCMTIVKQQELVNQFYESHYDEYVQPLIDEENPMMISHILIKVDKVLPVFDDEGNIVGHEASPTAEEQAKLDEVLEQLKTEDFSTVALTYSEDTGSAVNGGSLGLNLTSTLENYVLEFKEACKTLKPGEISDVITTEYGFHIIYAEEANKDELLSNSTFIEALETKFPNLTAKAILDKGNELGFVIISEDLKSEFDSIVGGE